ncbi:hypothetical protein BGW37DRAFT_491674 [Umbelopsis sp. PMI_123]|nr:hypothetical protein BGW37DRAFT_491674 [Umbelopsis sp. PMI_123]
MEVHQVSYNEESHITRQKGRLYVKVGDQKTELLTVMSKRPLSNQKMALSLLPQLATIVILEIALPLGLYFGLRQPTGPLNPVWALLVAGCPPLLVVIFKLLTKFKIDGAGLLLVIGFVTAAVVAAVSQSAKVLLLEKSIVTGAIGIVFGISLVPFHFSWKGKVYHMRPLTYILCLQFLPVDLTYELDEDQSTPIPTSNVQRAQQALEDDEDGIQMSDITSNSTPRSPQPNTDGLMVAIQKQRSKRKFSFGFENVELPLMAFLYHEFRTFRLVCILITLIWSIGFLIELAIRLALIFTMSDFDRIFLLSNIVFAVALILCAVATSMVSLAGHFRLLKELKQFLDQGPR